MFQLEKAKYTFYRLKTLHGEKKKDSTVAKKLLKWHPKMMSWRREPDIADSGFTNRPIPNTRKRSVPTVPRCAGRPDFSKQKPVHLSSRPSDDPRGMHLGS